MKTPIHTQYICVIAILICLCTLSACHRRQDTAMPQATTLTDLEGHTTAVITGSTQDIAMSAQYPNVPLIHLSSPAEIFEAVACGKVEYCILDSMMAIGLDLPQHGVQYLFATDVTKGEMAVAFSLQDRTLCTAFNNMLQQLQDDGTIAEMKARWTSGNPSIMKMPPLPLPTKGEPLKVGTSVVYPFEYIENGEWTGFEVELMQRFSCYIDRPIQIENYDFSGIIAALGCGKIDVISSSLMVTPEREKQVQFSHHYLSSHTSCFGRVTNTERALNDHRPTIGQRIHSNLIEDRRWLLLLDGLWATLLITIGALALGTIIGGGICWLRMHHDPVLCSTAKTYIQLMRNLPVLVFLMLMFYIVFGNSQVSGITIAIIAFAMNFAAYVSEMFRVSIESVNRGQHEAALAMGFSPVRAFYHVVVPQALQRVIPIYKGEAISLLKNTSIVGYIAIQDLTKASDLIRSRTFDAFLPLIIISIIYFVLAWIIGRLLDKAL
ncbi:MAG: ABC transporter permease subunit [Bacteroidales bacterium]|nr:ABC transporter permease subunit [Candidatus Colimorpha onthohippi]